MNKVINPHDSFFRETFSRKEIAASFLQEYLPDSIIRQMDLATLTIVKDSFVEKELQHHFSDLLYTIHHQQSELYLYFLFEHKSSPDPWIGLQLLRYQVRIWEQHRKQHPKEKLLPAIIPLVLYHGRQKWKISRNFRSLIVQETKDIDPFIPDFKYLLYDLSTLSDKQIKGKVLQRITLLFLKHIFDPDLTSKLPEILALLQEVEGKEDILEILEILLRYVVTATKKFDEHELKEILNQSFIEENIMENFIDKYIAQGLQKGMQQGIQQGMQQGMYKILTTQLTSRFGTLPTWAKKKIEEADAVSIEAWSLKLLSASSVDEVFH